MSLSLTPVPSPGAAREKLALSPDQFDMSWFTGRLSPASTGTSAKTGNSANTGVSASALGGDRVASAAARLLAAAPAASAQPEAAELSLSPPPPGKFRAAPESPPPEPADESTVPDALTEQTETFEGQPAAEDGSKVGEGKGKLAKLQFAQLSKLPDGGPSDDSQEASSAGGSNRKAVALPGIVQKEPATAVSCLRISQRPIMMPAAFLREKILKLALHLVHFGRMIHRAMRICLKLSESVCSTALIAILTCDVRLRLARTLCFILQIAHKGPALPEAGSEVEGSPRPPGLLYKPELRSVAERVKYIERRSHSRNLDSPRTPRGVPSPRAGAEAAGSHAPPVTASLQVAASTQRHEQHCVLEISCHIFESNHM